MSKLIKIAVANDDGEMLFDEEFRSLPLAICALETFQYELEQRETHWSEPDE